jgi:hypothetical protein
MHAGEGIAQAKGLCEAAVEHLLACMLLLSVVKSYLGILFSLVFL